MFTLGPFYLLSSESVSSILGKTSDVNIFPLEDVLFTGILRQQASASIINAFEHFRTDSQVNLHIIERSNNYYLTINILFFRYFSENRVEKMITFFRQKMITINRKPSRT